MLIRRLAIAGCLASFLLAVGCGPSGPKTFNVSGKVTFKGQPIPIGKIYFDPVEVSAPSGFADIVDGVYDTSKKGNKGVVAGKFKVRIQGYEKKGEDFGPPLFVEYPTEADFSGGQATQDFDVPATAAKGLPKVSAPLDP